MENLRSRVKTLDRFRRGPDTAVDKVSAERLDHGPARGTLPHMTPTICILAMCLVAAPADRQAQPPESGAQAARPSEVIESRPRQEQPERDVARVQSTPAVAPDELERRAEQGEPEAQNELGDRYANGTGVAKDEAKAVEWYRKAAEQGLAMAQYNLGVMYSAGMGVPKDEAKAIEWVRKAAEQGLAMAQYKLGASYALGVGLAKEPIIAHARWNIAASGVNDEASQSLPQLRSALTPSQIAAADRRARQLRPQPPVARKPPANEDLLNIPE